MKCITLAIYRLPTLFSATKEELKALFKRGVSRHLFPAQLAPGTTRILNEDQSTEHFHVFITFLIVLRLPVCTLK